MLQRLRGAGTVDRRHADEGAVAVEFALVLPLLVLFLFGILQFGLFFFRMQGMQASAHEGARGGSIGLTVAQISDRIEDALLVPVRFQDIDIDVVLVNSVTNTEVSRTDGKTTDPVLQALAPCNGLVDPEDHNLRVELSIPLTVEEYQVVIPVWGTLRVNYGATAVYGCEAVA